MPETTAMADLYVCHYCGDFSHNPTPHCTDCGEKRIHRGKLSKPNLKDVLREQCAQNHLPLPKVWTKADLALPKFCPWCGECLQQSTWTASLACEVSAHGERFVDYTCRFRSFNGNVKLHIKLRSKRYMSERGEVKEETVIIRFPKPRNLRALDEMQRLALPLPWYFPSEVQNAVQDRFDSIRRSMQAQDHQVTARMPENRKK